MMSLPAQREDGWDTDPVDTGHQGRTVSRGGAADNKSGIVTIAATIRALSGTYLLASKVVIEGEEETVGHLESFAETYPELFAVQHVHHYGYGKGDSAGEPF